MSQLRAEALYAGGEDHYSARAALPTIRCQACRQRPQLAAETGRLACWATMVANRVRAVNAQFLEHVA